MRHLTVNMWIVSNIEQRFKALLRVKLSLEVLWDIDRMHGWYLNSVIFSKRNTAINGIKLIWKNCTHIVNYWYIIHFFFINLIATILGHATVCLWIQKTNKKVTQYTLYIKPQLTGINWGFELPRIDLNLI